MPSSILYAFLLHACHTRSAPASEVGQLAEVLGALVVATFALVNRRDAFNERKCLDPFDHLEAELVLDPQAQQRPVQMRERLVVHLVGQQGLQVYGVLDREAVVELAALGTLTERVE